jgi:hypothetical protein
MDEDAGFPPRGTGPRLISVAEAALILRVSERDVLELMLAGWLEHVTLPGGERRVRLLDEDHDQSGATASGFAVLPFVVPGDADADAEAFGAELLRRRRDHELAGLEYGGVDVDALIGALAQRLAAVAPEGGEVVVERRMIWADGAGIDIPATVAETAGSDEDRVRAAAKNLLDVASEAFAELTAEPWPAPAGAYAGGFAPSGTAIDDGSLRMWWGDPGAPIVELEPIALADVIGA